MASSQGELRGKLAGGRVGAGGAGAGHMAGHLLHLGEGLEGGPCACCGHSSEQAISPQQALGMALPGDY